MDIEGIEVPTTLAFDDLPSAIFSEMRIKRSLFCGTTANGRMDIDDFDFSAYTKKFGLEPVFISQSSKSNSFNNQGVFTKEDDTGQYLIRLWTSKYYGTPKEGSLSVEIASNNIEGALSLSASLLSELTLTEPPEDHAKTVFWTQGSHGPSSMMKRIKCPEWAEIKDNYAENVTSKVEDLINGKQPSEPSGLILWTGEPGTGKTTALRAMIREWSKWCNAFVITDPENFLNDINYVNYVIMDGDEDDVFNSAGEPKPILLIMEDAGELITADARNNTGQALSRLLNITDGLLGQGLSLYVLITTNEDVGKLHEAVRRPGRCLSNIEFVELPKSEANDWLREKGVDDTVNRASTIAELYAKLKGATGHVVERKTSIGFASN